MLSRSSQTSPDMLDITSLDPDAEPEDDRGHRPYSPAKRILLLGLGIAAITLVAWRGWDWYTSDDGKFYNQFVLDGETVNCTEVLSEFQAKTLGEEQIAGGQAARIDKALYQQRGLAAFYELQRPVLAAACDEALSPDPETKENTRFIVATQIIDDPYYKDVYRVAATLTPTGDVYGEYIQSVVTID